MKSAEEWMVTRFHDWVEGQDDLTPELIRAIQAEALAEGRRQGREEENLRTLTECERRILGANIQERAVAYRSFALWLRDGPTLIEKEQGE